MSSSSSSSSYPLFTMRGGGGDDYFDSDADSYIAANAAAGVVAGGAGNAGADIAKKRKLSEASGGGGGGGGGGRRSAASSVSSRTSRRSPANVPVTTKADKKSTVEVSTTKKPKLGPISNADGYDDSDDDDDDDDKSFDSTTRVKEHDRQHATWSARGNLNFQTSTPTGGGGGTKTIDVQTNAPQTIRLNSISESDYTRAASAADVSSNKLLLSSTATATSSQQQQHQQRRWRSHQMAEDYISLASSITLPPITSTNGPIYGYDPQLGRYPIEQITTLGYLTSSLRRPQTILERWNPYEISLFEGAIAVYGKKFHIIAKYLQQQQQQQQQQQGNRKCTKDVIEFYYIWKKTSHGRRWKTSYVNEILDSDDVDDDADDEIAIDDNNRDVNNDDANAKKEVEDVSSKSNGPVAGGGGGVERGVV